MKTRAVLPERCRGCDVICFSRGFWLAYLWTDPWRGARLLHGKQGGQLNSLERVCLPLFRSSLSVRKGNESYRILFPGSKTVETVSRFKRNITDSDRTT